MATEEHEAEVVRPDVSAESWRMLPFTGRQARGRTRSGRWQARASLDSPLRWSMGHEPAAFQVQASAHCGPGEDPSSVWAEVGAFPAAWALEWATKRRHHDSATAWASAWLRRATTNVPRRTPARARQRDPGAARLATPLLAVNSAAALPRVPRFEMGVARQDGQQQVARRTTGVVAGARLDPGAGAAQCGHVRRSVAGSRASRAGGPNFSVHCIRLTVWFVRLSRVRNPEQGPRCTESGTTPVRIECE